MCKTRLDTVLRPPEHPSIWVATGLGMPGPADPRGLSRGPAPPGQRMLMVNRWGGGRGPQQHEHSREILRKILYKLNQSRRDGLLVTTFLAYLLNLLAGVLGFVHNSPAEAEFGLRPPRRF